jgi:hypothetical protein
MMDEGSLSMKKKLCYCENERSKEMSDKMREEMSDEMSNETIKRY